MKKMYTLGILIFALFTLLAGTVLLTTNTNNSIRIKINNNAEDKIPPEVQLILPEQIEIFSNYILLSAQATDNIGITEVTFYINEQNVGSVKKEPYILPFDTKSLDKGQHEIYAKATDTSENTAKSTTTLFQVDNTNTWYEAFEPLRTFYVSNTNNGGSGNTRTNPMSVNDAINNAKPGDIYYFLEGRYEINELILTKDGTKNNPIVYRAHPGEHVQLHGFVSIKGAHNWVWGFEIEDEGKFRSFCLHFLGPNQRAINNIMHSCRGLSAFRTGIGSIAYGNVIFEGASSPTIQRGHNIYTQNKYPEDGKKHFIGNIILDAPKQACNLKFDDSGNYLGANNCRGLHIYTEKGYISGFNLQYNIFADTRVLIGGYNVPTERNIVSENYFYKASPEIGYGRPSQIEFINNYLGNSYINAKRVWGAQEVNFIQKAPNIYLNNEIQTSGNNVFLMTSAYLESGRNEGGPYLQSSDIFDNNTYFESFRAQGKINNTEFTINSLEEFRTITKNAGNEFDSKSKVVPKEDLRIFVFQNEYEPNKFHLAIYNWDKKTNILLDSSSILNQGDSYKIVNVKDPFGKSVASGTYTGNPITINMNSNEFRAFFLIKEN